MTISPETQAAVSVSYGVQTDKRSTYVQYNTRGLL